MTGKRESWLDGLKGFAILLVVLGHVLSGYLDAGMFPSAYYSFYEVRSWIYSFHMPLFFMLSGFTFALAYYRTGKLRREGYLRQLLNLLWIYVLFVLLQWGVKQVVPQLVNETYTLEDLRRMFVEPLGNFWYLYVLLVLYLLAALVRLPKWPMQWLLLLGGGAILAADVRMDWTALTLYRIIYHLFFFALGTRSPGASARFPLPSSMVCWLAVINRLASSTSRGSSSWVYCRSVRSMLKINRDGNR